MYIQLSITKYSIKFDGYLMNNQIFIFQVRHSSSKFNGRYLQISNLFFLNSLFIAKVGRKQFAVKV